MGVGTDVRIETYIMFACDAGGTGGMRGHGRDSMSCTGGMGGRRGMDMRGDENGAGSMCLSVDGAINLQGCGVVGKSEYCMDSMGCTGGIGGVGGMGSHGEEDGAELLCVSVDSMAPEIHMGVV